MTPIMRARFARTGNPSRNTRHPSGTRTQSSGSSSTGERIRCLPSATNGIREICIAKDPKNTSTISRLTDGKTSSATRTFSQCSRPRSSIRQHGPSCSRKRVRNTSFRSPSITTASPCTTAALATGPSPKWAHAAIPLENSPRQCVRQGFISACRRTEWSTISFLAWLARLRLT